LLISETERLDLRVQEDETVSTPLAQNRFGQAPPNHQPVPSEPPPRYPPPKTADEWAYEHFLAFEKLCGNGDRIAERLEEARSYEPEDPCPSTSGEQAQPPEP
jgi:hypothetical protein